VKRGFGRLFRIGGIFLLSAVSAGAEDGNGSPSAPSEARNLQIIPIYEFQLLGGQNFYTGQKPSLSANASGVVAPAMKFNDNWSLLPSLVSNYTGTRQVVDLVGSGTLFSSQWDNQLTVKGLYTPDDSSWRIKPFLAYKYEFLQQTTDEQLGQGLYDYSQWDTGMDVEYVYHDPFAVRFGADYYQTHFPNYTSLESQAASQFQGQDLARELVGNYVLDSHNFLLSASMDAALPHELILEGKAGFLYEQFPNQHIVDAAGDLASPLRGDVITSLGLGVRRTWDVGYDIKALGVFDVAYSYDDSNQSSFDASETQYLPLFYNYQEWKLSPDLKFFFGPEKQPIVLDLSGAWWHRGYPHRPIQDPSGIYLNSTLYTDSWMAEAALAYPVAPHFNLVFNFQYGQETSNQQFLELYQYDYTTATYMFGFSYDY
jgi:hypothetical protein